jgi:hypothetical protein
MTLYPYLLGNIWVFDDARTKLKAEAFVLGASEMIHRLVQAKAIPDAGQGFALSFAAEPFGHDVELRWIETSEAATATGSSLGSLPSEGNWYTGEVAGEPMTCWLCPALFCYFEEAPEKIFAKAEPLPKGVDPIWHEAWQDPEAKRFMSAEG